MAIKMPTIETFMTQSDEREFSRLLVDNISDIGFIDLHHWKEPTPSIFKSIVDCSYNVTIINKNITSEDYYSKNYIKKRDGHNFYDGAAIGPGLIQYLRSREASYTPGGLTNGRLAASYDPEKEPEMDRFVKAVYNIFKKGSKKVYLIDPNSGTTSEKPETKFLTWPGAAEDCNGKNGRYLINHRFAYFVSK